jgi:hypothetical protein
MKIIYTNNILNNISEIILLSKKEKDLPAKKIIIDNIIDYYSSFLLIYITGKKEKIFRSRLDLIKNNVYNQILNNINENSNKTKHLNDFRSIVQTRINVSIGWIYEEFFILMFSEKLLKENNISFFLSGVDKKRNFNKSKNIFADPDLSVLINNNIIFKLEIQSTLSSSDFIKIKEQKIKILTKNKNNMFFLFNIKEGYIFYLKNKDLNYIKENYEKIKDNYKSTKTIIKYSYNIKYNDFKKNKLKFKNISDLRIIFENLFLINT